MPHCCERMPLQEPDRCHFQQIAWRLGAARQGQRVAGPYSDGAKGLRCQTEDPDGVVAVERALSILNAIEAAEADALSLTQIAAATRLSKSTTSRLLVSLLRSVYILRLPDGKYQLGPAVSRLGLRFDRSFMLAKYAEGVVRRIADRCNETTSLSVRHGDTRVCIMRFEPRHAFQYGTKVGVHMTLAK